MNVHQLFDSFYACITTPLIQHTVRHAPHRRANVVTIHPLNCLKYIYFPIVHSLSKKIVYTVPLDHFFLVLLKQLTFLFLYMLTQFIPFFYSSHICYNSLLFFCIIENSFQLLISSSTDEISI